MRTRMRSRLHNPFRVPLPLLLTVVAVILMIIALGLTVWARDPGGPAAGDGTALPESSPGVTLSPSERPTADPAPSGTAPSEESTQPLPSESCAVLPPEETGTDGAEAQEGYDFSQPVPESEAVGDDYLADAVFVGDSRTAGFMLYSGVTGASSVTHTGLSIFDVQKGKACIQVGGQKLTLQQALEGKEYGKIYLCLGVNELGYYNDQGFYEAFCELVTELRQSHPESVIYLQTLIPLNEEVIAQTGGRDYLKNDHLRIYNDLICQAAEDCRVPVVDVYSDFADENGSLPAEASNDGIHLNRSYCEQWLEYLKTHTVSYDTLYPEGADAT